MNSNFKEPLPTADFLACADTHDADIVKNGSIAPCDYCDDQATDFFAWNPPHEPFDMFICIGCLSTVKKGGE